MRGLGSDAERIDLLVNNAGVFKGGLLERVEPFEAIEDDDETLGPGGREGLAMKLPKPLMDLAAKSAFSR